MTPAPPVPLPDPPAQVGSHHAPHTLAWLRSLMRTPTTLPAPSAPAERPSEHAG